MPLIQELPNSSTSTAPGWAFVPDTGFDPSKEAILPSGSRQRGRQRAGNTAQISSKHQAKIASYVESLKRDAPKDTNITVPGKAKDSRGLHGKMTPAVKRIVTSQKTFANHLNDEEAALANRPSEPSSSSAPRRTSGKIEKLTAAGPKHRASPVQVGDSSDAMDTDTLATNAGAPYFRPAPSPFPVTPEDSDPFFQSDLPQLPSREEIDALLARPALPFSQAVVAPTTSTAAARQFCDICNYWGLVRCLRCNARVCGLQCKVRHEETRCYPF